MVGKYKAITFCGSTLFKDAFIETQKRLTLERTIVIGVGFLGHSGDEEIRTEGAKDLLDEMYKRKIGMVDEIFVINVGGYMMTVPGQKSRIVFANNITTRKTIRLR